MLKSITCPTSIISGRQDRFFGLDEGQTIASHLANANMIIIEECGHMIPMEQPQATTALFRLWLEL